MPARTPSSAPARTPAPVAADALPGPYAVGEYASALRSRLREFARVQLVGELVNLRPSRARVYFELRDPAGVITAREGKARDDVMAALARRGWAGRLVWGFAPVQDRHAAPAIVRALGDMASVAAADVVIVARGGGSLADLLCFCDEALCRTV